MPHPVSCAPAGADAGMVAGVVYEREGWRTYGIDGPFFEGIGGAEVKVGDAAAGTSEPCGAYSVAAPARTLVTLHGEGFADSWFRHHDDAHSRQDVGLYREQAVTPRPGFMKGVHVDTNDPRATVEALLDTYAHAASLGAKLVVDKRAIDVLDFDDRHNVVKMSTAELRSPAEYKTLADGARARGVELVLYSRVEPHSFPLYFDVFNANLDNDPLWDAWFAAYTEAIVVAATRARDAGIGTLVLGGGGGHRHAYTRWESVVRAIRDAGFSGQLMYVGSFAPYPSGDFIELARANHNDPGPFLAQFDAVGMTIKNLYLGGARRTRDALASNLRSLVLTAGAGLKPVVLFVETAATADASTSDDFVGLCETRPSDFYQQADVYQAVFEAVNQGANIAGVFTNEYRVTDNDCDGLPNLTGDTSPSIHSKPAEAVLSWWFKRL